MKKIFVFFSLLLIFVSAVFAENIIESIAIISDYSGTATVTKSGSDRAENAEFGMPVHAGDQIRTGSGSFAEITFDNATLLKVGPSSTLKIDDVSKNGGSFKAAFSLAAGKLHALFRKLNQEDSGTFEIRTKMALAAVKGTDIVIVSSDEDTGLGVFEGAVDLFSLDEQGGIKEKEEVKAGEESSVKKDDDKPSKPEGLKRFLDDKREIEKMKELLRLRKERGAGNYREDMKQRSESEERGKKLKNRARKEMKNTAKKLSDSLAFIRKEQKNDSNLGKTLIDAFGNRVRVEEFVVRPGVIISDVFVEPFVYETTQPDNRIDFINITKRENRTDMMINSYEFNYPLNYKKPDWRKIWHNYDWDSFQDYVVPNHMSSNTRTFKNLDSGNELRFESEYVLEFFSNYTQPPVDAVLFPQNEYVFVNEHIVESRYIYSFGEAGINSFTDLKEFYYQMAKDELYDQTYSYEPVERTDYIGPYQLVTDYGDEITLPGNEKHIYNNGEWLEYSYYYIDSAGNDVKPGLMSGEKTNLGDYFLQLKINSSLFDNDYGIDVVSQWLLKEKLLPMTFYDLHVMRDITEVTP